MEDPGGFLTGKTQSRTRIAVGEGEQEASFAGGVAVDGGAAGTPPSTRAETLEFDLEDELVAGTDEAAESHPLHTAEEGKAVAVAGVGEEGDGARLGERLELDDAGKDRVVGEVTGEERLVPRDQVSGGDRATRVAGVDGVDESEGRPVRKEGDQVVGQPVVRAVGVGHGRILALAVASARNLREFRQIV